MTRTNLLSALAALATLCLIGLSSDLPLYAMWGLNHLHYLDTGWTHALLLASVTILVVGMVPLRSAFLHRMINRAAALLWERGPLFRLLTALSAGVVFYLLRLKLFFVGDGYHLLSTFGGLSEYNTGLTKPGSVVVIQLVQYLLGDVSHESATAAFQIVSIVSGMVVVYNLIGIAGEMATESSRRFFCLITLLFSGAMLLFFGHVEFYPLVWAAATFFFMTSLRFLNHRVRLWPAVISLAVALILHIQAVCFLPALAYLIWLRMNQMASEYSRSVWLRAVAIVIPVLCLAGGTTAAHVYPDVRSFILPLFTAEPSWAKYGVMSLHAALELVNLVFVVVPGILLLLVVAVREKNERPGRLTQPFFVLAAACAAGFLLVVNPSLGMARDFDLMSLMVIPLVLLLLERISNGSPGLLLRPLLLMLIVSAFGTSAFLATNISVEPCEKRIHSLLSLYGSRDRGGWVSYTGYLKVEGRLNAYHRAMREMDKYYPEHASLRQIDSLLAAGQGQEAERLSEVLVMSHPRSGLFLRKQGQLKARRGDHEGALALFERAATLRPDHVSFTLLGLEYLSIGRAVDAVEALERAHELAPMDPGIMEGLASSLLNINQISRALSLADTLFELAPDRPGGHLIRMMGAIHGNDLERARYHYRYFQQTGKGRADYGQIVEAYKFLMDSEDK